jgi:hypothetical protein
MIITTYKYIIAFIFFTNAILHAQNDTIHLKNNNVLVGEVKSFRTGIIIIETSYSEEDFKIEFNKVKKLFIQRKCHIILTDNRRRFGNISTDPNGTVVITLENGKIERYRLEEVVALMEVEDNFWKRFKASIDLSYNFTKANNDKQFTITGEFEYINKRVLLNGKISVLNSTQDNADNIKRTDANLDLKRLFSKKWYFLGEFSFLKNTEQALEGRFFPNIGVGRFLLSKDNFYLGLSIGYAYIIENYVDAALDKTSSEMSIYSDFNMFDFNDFSLKTKIKVYPSLSEEGRIRTDFDLSLKYDLPLDFYIKMGFTLNFDNQPAIAGNDFDYVFNSGVGWKID